MWQDRARAEVLNGCGCQSRLGSIQLGADRARGVLLRRVRPSRNALEVGRIAATEVQNPQDNADRREQENQGRQAEGHGDGRSGGCP